jgi:hypothetical protein
MRWKNLRAEIDAHIEEKALDLIESGVPEQEAWERARREFGNATLVTESSREVWIWTWMERLWQDLVYARRILSKHAGFTAIAVISLAMGVGANCAMFSLADALLLRPLPVPDPEEVLSAGEREFRDRPGGRELLRDDRCNYRSRPRLYRWRRCRRVTGGSRERRGGQAILARAGSHRQARAAGRWRSLAGDCGSGQEHEILGPG